MNREKEKLLRKLLETAETSSMYRETEIRILESKLNLSEDKSSIFYDLILLYFELGLRTGLKLNN